MKKLIIFLLCSQLASAELWTGVVDSPRAVNWQNAGTTITNRTVICQTIAPYNGNTNTINTAIAGCGTNQVVLLQPGIFNLSGGINYASKSNVSVRGSGADATFLIFTSNVNCNGISSTFCMAGNNCSPGSSIDHTANVTGAGQDVSSVTLSSVTGLVSGNIMVFDRLNDSNVNPNAPWICENLGICASEGPAGAGRSGRSQAQVVRVTSIVGPVVGFDPPLRMVNWNAGTPQAWWCNTIPTGMGLEDLSIDMTGANSQSGILMFNIQRSWVQGVRSIDADRNHVWMFQAKDLNISDNYFYETKNHASQSYGIEPFLTSDDLVQNNIFEKVAAPITVNGPCTGCVFGYNYAINDLWFAGNLSAQAWLHSSGVDYVLLEGNIGPGFFGDLIHGTHNFVTALRNYWIGWETGLTSQTNAVLLAPGSRYFNLISNVLGENGYHNCYQGTSATCVYNIGNAQGGIGSDSLVTNSLLRWGNYDVVNAAVRFVSGEVPSGISPYPSAEPATHAIPNSFYLTARPPFWPSPTTTRPWPGVGGDITSGTIANVGGHVYPNPAMDCYNNTSSSGGIKNFDRLNCYYFAGDLPLPVAHRVIISEVR